MIYTVVWSPTALSHLATLYNAAVDPAAVTDASNRIDRLLRVNPETKGQPFAGGRLLVVLPLAVSFTVSPDDCLVEVFQVRRLTTLQP